MAPIFMVMSRDRTLARSADGSHDTAFKELQRVRLVVPVQADEQPVDAGSVGTIVHRYQAGRAYEVEFSAPRHVVVTVEPWQLASA